MELDTTGSLQKPDLFEKFKIQVHKDFELAGASEYTPVIISNELLHLRNAFHHSIVKLEISNALKIVLYRVDITEQQIIQSSQKQPEVSLQYIIAELMIKRILQKVILKELYSK